MSQPTHEEKLALIDYSEPGWVERACWVACTLPRLIEEEAKQRRKAKKTAA
jgi:hypothetical protein